MKNLLTKALLAVAGAALVSTSAHAATTTYNAGDVMLGFDQTGSANDYLIDLGPVTQFASALGPIQFNLSLSDLNTLFTNNWSTGTDSTLRWGLAATSSNVGALGYEAYSLWASRAESTVGTQSTPWTDLVKNTAQTTTSAVSSMTSFYKNTTASSSTMSAGIQATTQSTSQTNSWASRVLGTSTGGKAFGVWDGSIQSNFGNGTAGTALDFYYLPVGGGITGAQAGDNAQLLGSFTIDNNATLTFTPVPEPSSFVMLGIGAGALLLVLRRQRRSVAA